MTDKKFSMKIISDYILDLFKDSPKFGYSKFIQKYAWVVLLLFLLFANFDLRNQNLDLEITDEWSRDSLRNNFINRELSVINQKYPNVNNEAKQELAQKAWTEFESSNSQMIDEQLILLSNNLKDEFQNENGETYLIAIDPYYYLRQVENLNNTGHIGSLVVDGKSYDHLQRAPNDLSNSMKGTLHPYFSYYFYLLMNFFFGWSLYKSFFVVPSVVIALAILFAFLLGRKVAGTLCGFVFAYIVGFHGSILARTVSGFSDTDAYTIWLPIMILYFIFNGFTIKNNWRFLHLALAGFSGGLFAFAWVGYWYIIDLILAGMGAYLVTYIYIEYKSKKNLKEVVFSSEIKNTAFNILLFLVFTLVSVTIFVGFGPAKSILVGPFSFLNLKAATSGTSIWPNVFHTVAELNPSSFAQTMSSIAFGSVAKGFTLSILGFIGLILLALDHKNEKFNLKVSIFSAIWFLVLFWSTFKGVRFIMTAVIAFAFIVAIFFGKVNQSIQGFSKKHLQLSKISTSFMMIIMVCLFVTGSLFPYGASQQQAYQSLPSMNDAWDGVLNKIATETDNDTIITSWWDFGHQFITESKRGTTFDGGSQSGDRAHWVGRTLSTSSEREAIGILNMLHCSNNRFISFLEKYMDQYEAIKLTEELVLLDRKGARDLLLTLELPADDLIDQTHCNPADGIFITSQDMVGKGGVWAHFGTWDFDKAQLWSKRDESVDSQKEFLSDLGFDDIQANKLINEMNSNRGDDRAVQTWISGWPSYFGEYGCSRANGLVSCNVNIQGQAMKLDFNSENNETRINGAVSPASFTYMNSKYQPVTIKYNDSELGISFVLFSKNGQLSVAAMDPLLAESMFTRLYYLDGYGLKYFKPFDERSSRTGFKISTWTVDWDSEERLLPEQKEYQVSHILITHNESIRAQSNKTKSQAFELVSELSVNSENFSQVAVNYSDDPSVQFNLGNLGWTDLNGFASNFSQATKKMDVGEISDIIETEFGYHIIHLNDIRAKKLNFVIN